MNDDELEHRLRRALRPVDAPAGFTERLLEALPGKPPLASVTPLRAAPPRPVARWRQFTVPTTLAASLLAAVLLGQHMATQRAEQDYQAGLAASRELMQALRVTSEKLDVAYRAVQQEEKS